jgi:hypothetical protein
MDGVGPRRLRRFDVRIGFEVRADRLHLVGAARVQGSFVVGSSDGDRGDAEPLAGAEDPNGDLAAVGYEEFSDLPVQGVRGWGGGCAI